MYYHFLHIVCRHPKSQPFLVYRTEKNISLSSEVTRRPIPVPTTIPQILRFYSCFIWLTRSIESLNCSESAARWTSIFSAYPISVCSFPPWQRSCAGSCFVHQAYYCWARGANREASVLHVAANAQSKLDFSRLAWPRSQFSYCCANEFSDQRQKFADEIYDYVYLVDA